MNKINKNLNSITIRMYSIGISLILLGLFLAVVGIIYKIDMIKYLGVFIMVGLPILIVIILLSLSYYVVFIEIIKSIKSLFKTR